MDYFIFNLFWYDFCHSVNKSNAMKRYLFSLSAIISTFMYSQNYYTANSLKKQNFVNVIDDKDKNEPLVTAHLEENTKLLEIFSSSKVTLKKSPKTNSNILFGSSSVGWTNLNLNTEIVNKSSDNMNLVTVEGTAVFDSNDSKKTQGYIIGLFVDNKLQFSQEFTSRDSVSHFLLSGIIENLEQGKHSVQVFARNISNDVNKSKITFGNSSKEKEHQLRLSIQQAD